MLERAGTGPIDRLVGARIRAARDALGLTPAGLAARLGCHPGQVVDYESGRRRAGAATLLRLSEVCGLGLGFFYAELDAAAGGRQGADQSSSSS